MKVAVWYDVFYSWLLYDAEFSWVSCYDRAAAYGGYEDAEYYNSGGVERDFYIGELLQDVERDMCTFSSMRLRR